MFLGVLVLEAVRFTNKEYRTPQMCTFGHFIQSSNKD